MNLANYRDWSADVNLISDHLSRAIAQFSDPGYIARGLSRKLFCALLDG
jgi:hypothetical protein